MWKKVSWELTHPHPHLTKSSTEETKAGYRVKSSLASLKGCLGQYKLFLQLTESTRALTMRRMCFNFTGHKYMIVQCCVNICTEFVNVYSEVIQSMFVYLLKIFFNINHTVHKVTSWTNIITYLSLCCYLLASKNISQFMAKYQY